MDASSAKDAKNFLSAQADDDRKDAKAKHLSKGLRTAKELVATMQKSVAHGIASQADEIQRVCLDELAELGNAIRDAARAAIRNSTSEAKNVQE
jgi:hypothetical protein